MCYLRLYFSSTFYNCNGGCMDNCTADPRLTAENNLPVHHLEYYSLLQCTMTLDVQTVVVFTVIAILVLVNVILMFFLGSR